MCRSSFIKSEKSKSCEYISGLVSDNEDCEEYEEEEEEETSIIIGNCTLPELPESEFKFSTEAVMFTLMVNVFPLQILCLLDPAVFTNNDLTEWISRLGMSLFLGYLIGHGSTITVPVQFFSYAKLFFAAAAAFLILGSWFAIKLYCERSKRTDEDHEDESVGSSSDYRIIHEIHRAIDFNFIFIEAFGINFFLGFAIGASHLEGNGIFISLSALFMKISHEIFHFYPDLHDKFGRTKVFYSIYLFKPLQTNN